MANILYGVNGEGAGHSSRSKEVITHLIERGHRVHVASFDRGLKNLAPFFEVTEVYGLRFAYVNNRVRYGKTVAKNLLTAPKAAKSLRKLADLADELQIEMVFTDFEPLSCHFGRRRRLPVISIDNQHCLTNAEVSYPRRYRKEAAAAKLVTRLMTPHADAYLATSFFDAPVRKANTWLVPPIVRREVLGVRPSSEEHILVYVTSPSPQLVKVLRGVRARFFCYGFDGSGSEGNLLFKKPSLEGFLTDLVVVPGDHRQLGIFAGERGAALGEAVPGVSGGAAVRANLQRVLSAEVRLWRLLGGADARVCGVVFI